MLVVWDRDFVRDDAIEAHWQRLTGTLDGRGSDPGARLLYRLGVLTELAMSPGSFGILKEKKTLRQSERMSSGVNTERCSRNDFAVGLVVDFPCPRLSGSHSLHYLPKRR